PEFGPSTFFVTSHAGIPYTPEQYRRGFRGALISFPLNEHSPLSGLKTLNCLDHVLGRKEAADRGCDEGIFLNQKHYLAEGTASNLFLVKGGVLYTPPVEAGILPGITRALVIKLADKKIKLHEQNISPLFLKEADEAFLTNSLLEAMPLVAIEDEPIGRGEPGPVTADLRYLYREYLEKHLGSSP
ncbi:MAG: aminotransferase class IV, partial [Firmicutes bacterium]|nr:aminotransferase class IV [Bacillota bacterium]